VGRLTVNLPGAFVGISFARFLPSSRAMVGRHYTGRGECGMLRQWSWMMVVLGLAALMWFAPAAGLGGLLLAAFLHDRACNPQGQRPVASRHASHQLDHLSDRRAHGQRVTEAKEAGMHIARQRRDLGEMSGNRPMDMFQ
jgi:hypothetical protein